MRWGRLCGENKPCFHSRRERGHEPFYKRIYSRSPCESNFLSRQAANVIFPRVYLIMDLNCLDMRRLWDDLVLNWFYPPMQVDGKTIFLPSCWIRLPQWMLRFKFVRVFVSLHFVFLDFIFNLALTLLSVNINIWQRIPASFYKRIYHYINKRMNFFAHTTKFSPLIICVVI